MRRQHLVVGEGKGEVGGNEITEGSGEGTALLPAHEGPLVLQPGGPGRPWSRGWGCTQWEDEHCERRGTVRELCMEGNGGGPVSGREWRTKELGFYFFL